MYNQKFKKVIYFHFYTKKPDEEIITWTKNNKPDVHLTRYNYGSIIRLIFRNKAIENLFRLHFNDKIEKWQLYTDSKKETYQVR